MLLLRSFINLFAVPVIALVLIHKKEGLNLKPSFALLIEYCLIISLNIPLTRIFTFFYRIVSGIDIEADSSYYTICAIFASVLMAVLNNIYIELRKNSEEQKTCEEDIKENENKAYK